MVSGLRVLYSSLISFMATELKLLAYQSLFGRSVDA